MSIPLETLQTLDRAVLIELIIKLSTEMDKLTERLNKNSTNSSKPPSSDGLTKPSPKSLRKKGERKNGGQKGHRGSTLERADKPDVTVTLTPSDCMECGHDLQNESGITAEKRQVFDIPKPALEVTEYVSVEKCCSKCGAKTCAEFPEGVRSHVQYGSRIHATSIYMLYQQFIPEARLAEVFADTYGIKLCSATLGQSWKKIYNNLDEYEKNVEQFLSNSKLVHFDETGMRVQQKLAWLHSASNAYATIYKIDAKRGFEAMEKFHIHQNFKGIAVHDYWKPYLKLTTSEHALCNAHILRELVGIYENHSLTWTKEMEGFLYKAHKYVSEFQEKKKLPLNLLKKLTREYESILHAATQNYDKMRSNSSSGKRAKSAPGEALCLRMTNHKSDILRFMHDFDVPFTNNQAEQDIRMCKLRQKISGCFRSNTGPEIFCRIRGYLSTARKQGLNIMDAITDAIAGQPFTISA